LFEEECIRIGWKVVGIGLFSSLYIRWGFGGRISAIG